MGPLTADPTLVPEAVVLPEGMTLLPEETTSTVKDLPDSKTNADEESREINKLIGDFQIPAFSSIKDTDYICVKNPIGEVVGEYYKRCRRMTKKGPGMHWTGTHKSKKTGNETNNGNGNGNTNFTSTASTLTSSSDAAAIAQAAAKAAIEAMQAQTKTSSDIAPPSILKLRGINYETEPKSVGFAANLCSSLTDYLDDDEFYDAIGSQSKDLDG